MKACASTKTAAVLAICLVGVGCQQAAKCHQALKTTGEGFSRADQFPPGPVPVVTTRLYELDEKGFPKHLPATKEAAQAQVFVPTNAWEELDDIYGLMALAVVHADWQESPTGRTSPHTRGHNIGSIIVNRQLEVVNWERNSNEAMCNGTQHGEVRVMLKQLNRTGSTDLREHQVYTSLEPCMMCSGMMMQQRILRTVYMQTDNGFGKNIERLTIDSSSVPVRFDDEDTGQHGYPPAARPVISNMSQSEFRAELDVAWRAASSTMPLTDWLKTDEAQEIFARARYKFEHYPLRFGDKLATAKFIVPKGSTNAKMAEKDFLILQADKTNAQLYQAALDFLNDPSRDIIPYVHPDGPTGSAPLVEDTANVLATRLLEDPAALVQAEHPRGEPDALVPTVPATQLLVVDGFFNGTHVHQERVRRECRQ